MSIEKTVIDKGVMKGLLLYVGHQKNTSDGSKTEQKSYLALGCILHTSTIEEEFMVCNNLTIIQNSYLNQWHDEFDQQVEELKQSFSSMRIIYMVSMIEQFIKDTVKSSYDEPRVLC